MSEILNAIVGYPGVVATVMLGVVMAYWLFVMLGALDIDVLGGHGSLEGATKGAMDGMADGALHGAAKGVAEGLAGGADGHIDGAVDGAVEGHVDGAVEGASKAAAEAAANGAVDSAIGAAKSVGHGATQAADLMSIANFRSVPVTVMLSVVVCFGWLFSVAGSRSLQATAGSWPVPWWVLGTVILVVAFVLALVPTAVTIRPMSRFFVTHEAKRHTELVGKVCVISTGRVDAKFGQASLESEGMSLLIQVRTDHPTGFKKGSKALIVSWDAQRGAFVVEPYDEVMKDG